MLKQTDHISINIYYWCMSCKKELYEGHIVPFFTIISYEMLLKNWENKGSISLYIQFWIHKCYSISDFVDSAEPHVDCSHFNEKHAQFDLMVEAG